MSAELSWYKLACTRLLLSRIDRIQPLHTTAFISGHNVDIMLINHFDIFDLVDFDLH